MYGFHTHKPSHCRRDLQRLQRSSLCPRSCSHYRYPDFKSLNFLIQADEVYIQCDPEKENLCLYGHPTESWEVTLPAEEVPPELPEPALGINFARDGMSRKDWLSLVAVHSDCWLLSMAFYFGARLNRNDRKRLFSMINDLPTLFEIVTGRKPVEDKPGAESGSKSRNNTKRSIDGQARSNSKLSYVEDEDEHGDTICGSCAGNYNADEFWIGCDICERWYHGKCVKITPAKAESIKQYKCPSCSTKKSRH
ncbi:hypothetical protein POTOM_031215 [Populus tomentosa]|uniref:PHD finger protein ALFIN-LIKE n=1 Tax=Populus tomentosa TaxID=118781 RepID=A0A8X8CRI4_POPTO|nr:hypothetical protein POTOM_031215 [Populus tomentosa]